MKFVAALSIAILLSGRIHSQAVQPRIQSCLVAGAGYSLYSSNAHKKYYRYPTTETRIGISFIRSVSNRFDFELRPVIGRKQRSKTRNGHPFDYLDETASLGYTFAELSAFGRFDVSDNVSIKCGLNSRVFMPDSSPFAYLGGKHDFGIISGAGLNLSPRVELSVEYVFGLSKVIRFQQSIDSQPASGVTELKTRGGNFTLGYTLRKQ